MIKSSHYNFISFNKKQKIVECLDGDDSLIEDSKSKHVIKTFNDSLYDIMIYVCNAIIVVRYNSFIDFGSDYEEKLVYQAFPHL